jgi:cell division protein FtsB
MNKSTYFRKAVAILVLFVILAGIHLFISAQNIGLKYKITDLKIKLAELNSLSRTLGSRMSQGEDLGYIEKTAKGKLGMIYPENITYIVMSAKGRKSSSGTAESPARN